MQIVKQAVSQGPGAAADRRVYGGTTPAAEARRDAVVFYRFPGEVPWWDGPVRLARNSIDAILAEVEGGPGL